MNIKKVFLTIALMMGSAYASAQFTYGTTGLLHAPSADMQQDKTFLFGGGYLDKQATPSKWTYNTWNYYINITFLPWLEVGYMCTIFNHWTRGGKVHMLNQDRSFHGRLRIWKEGWWKEWTPQIVVGVNDVTTGALKQAGGNDYMDFDTSGDGNGYFNRWYLAATKHINWYGIWGIHAAYVYNKRGKDKLNGPTFGVDYQFALAPTNGWAKAVNGLNLIAEYDSKFLNVGAKYSIWKDHINVVGELRDCKYPSVGVYFKVHLK